MKALKIIAKIVVKPAFEKEFYPELVKVVDATRQEPGNVSYELHRDINNPLSYVMMEVWSSQEAIDSHNASAHFIAFAQAAEGKLEQLEVTTVEFVY